MMINNPTSLQTFSFYNNFKSIAFFCLLCLFVIPNNTDAQVVKLSDDCQENVFSFFDRFDTWYPKTFLNGLWLFSAYNEGVYELFKTDGTVDGTVPLRDKDGNKVLSPSKFIILGEKFIFFTPDFIYSSDGTSAGTIPITPFFHDFITDQTIIGDKLYFNQVQIVGNSHPGTFFITNGTTSGTYSITKGLNNKWISHPSNMTSYNDIIIFSAGDEGSKPDLWRTDGTIDGTFNIYELLPCPDNHYCSIRDIFVFGDKVLFQGNDEEHGKEIWITDGTSEGTHLFQDINEGPESSNPRMIYKDESIYLAVDDGIHGEEIWKLDNLESEAYLFSDVNPGPHSSNIKHLFKLNDQFVIVGSTLSYGEELYSMSNSGIIELIKDINPGPENSTNYYPFISKNNFFEVNNELFFLAYAPQNGIQIWKSDGTPNGTIHLSHLSDTNEYLELAIKAFNEESIIYSIKDLDNKWSLYTSEILVGTDNIDVNHINITISPNPSKQNINVESDDIIDLIYIRNIQGKMILEESVDHKNKTIDINHLSKGVYFIYTQIKDQINVSKFVKI